MRRHQLSQYRDLVGALQGNISVSSDALRDVSRHIKHDLSDGEGRPSSRRYTCSRPWICPIHGRDQRRSRLRSIRQVAPTLRCHFEHLGGGDFLSLVLNPPRIEPVSGSRLLQCSTQFFRHLRQEGKLPGAFSFLHLLSKKALRVHLHVHLCVAMLLLDGDRLVPANPYDLEALKQVWATIAEGAFGAPGSLTAHQYGAAEMLGFPETKARDGLLGYMAGPCSTRLVLGLAGSSWQYDDREPRWPIHRLLEVIEELALLRDLPRSTYRQLGLIRRIRELPPPGADSLPGAGLATRSGEVE